MKYRKFNKYEKKEIRAQSIAAAMHGEGLYLFENSSTADLTLPRPTHSGLRVISGKAQFQGDNYYMQLVRTGFLRLIKEIQSPEQQRAASEVKPVEEKLLLEQPDTIGDEGKVEHVVAKPKQKINESGKPKPPPVLLNEEGFVVIKDK